jgi:hypothetical protein
MKPVDQTKFGNEGNCLAACLASVFECRIEECPDFDALYKAGKDWWGAMREFCLPSGYSVIHVGVGWMPRPPAGYHLMGGKSPRPDVTHGHLVVVRNGVIVHDPHPSRAGIIKVDDYYLMVPMVGAVPLGD